MGTVVVWPGSDQVAWDLIREAHPEYDQVRVIYGDPQHQKQETLVDKNGVDLPIEPEPPIIANNNLILIGGDYPNPYVKKYFMDPGLIKPGASPTEGMEGEGVYANGKRCIATVTRENMTTVTAIFGWNAIDTLYAMQDYLHIGPAREVFARFKGARGVVSIVIGA